MKCPNCKITVTGKQKYCRYCGSKLPRQKKNNLAQKLLENGRKQNSAEKEPARDSELQTSVDIVMEREMPFSKYTRIISTSTKPSRNTIMIDINTAPPDELAGLPGINTIVAKRIVYMRQARDGFKSFEEFGSAMNLSPYILNKIKQRAVITGNAVFTHNPPNRKYSARIVDY